VSLENNKALVRREQEELWNHTGNLDAAEELFVPEQAEAARQEAADFRRGFPDVVSIIEDLIAEGNKVAARWRARATHQGEYVDIPPTGKEVEFTGISVYRIEGRLGPDAPDRRRSRAGAIAVGQSRTSPAAARPC
jgi:predicted ester cyclase